MKRIIEVTLPLVAIFALSACGGGGSNSVTPPSTPASTPVNAQGQWQIVAHSTVTPSQYLLIGANLSQTGSAISSTPLNTAVVAVNYDGRQSYGWQLGGACGAGQLGTVSIDGTIANGTALTFTFSEGGQAGTNTVAASGTISADGKTINGTYTAPAGCGFSSDAGTFTASQVNLSGTYDLDPNFSSALGSGTVVVSQGNNYTVTVSGTVNGSTLSATGDVIGGLFSVAGAYNGSQVSYVGVLLPSGFGQYSGEILVIDSSTDALVEVLKK